MTFYNVKFGDYSLSHSIHNKYFNHFEFQGKKYYIGSHIKLSEKGMGLMYHNGVYSYRKGDFRLIDHEITDKGFEEWTYLIGWYYDSKIPRIYTTRESPDVLISEVIAEPIDESVEEAGELHVEFVEPNYFPKDWEVPGLITGWVMAAIAWFGAYIFKDWWLVLMIQLGVCFYFAKWRDNKINEAITTQKFVKR